MSKESYIGGNYIETTGGNSESFAKGKIINSSLEGNFSQNGVTNGIFNGANKPAPTIIGVPQLKKFLVHFRRPSSYKGEYGFDWLREEYFIPIVTVTNDNNGDLINSTTALCKDVIALKQEYLNDVINNISPYGIRYYPAWLSIFPHTQKEDFAHGSTMHKDGVNLDLQFDELETIISDGTEILLESTNQFLKISPQKLPIAKVINSGKKSRNLNGKIINYYKLNKIVNIKCTGGALNQHTEIKVFAKLDQQKVEVGKLMVYKNNVIPKVELVVVNVITGAKKAQLKDDYQYIFKRQSFNQALIRAEVKVDTEFDINSLPQNDPDVIVFKQNMNGNNSEFIKNAIGKLYDKFGKYKATGGINSNQNKRTYLFLTSLSAGNVLGSCSIDSNENWGNFYIVYNAGLKDEHTIVHECGHSLSLPHVFQEGSRAKHTFYHGYTDNYMDYTWQSGIYRNNKLYSSGTNVYKGKMFSFFKWQWDIMRSDRSLIFNY